MCFDFTIIVCADGVEIIDRRQKTFYHQLTPMQMVEYMEMEIQLAILDGMGCQARLETESKWEFVSIPVCRLVCLCETV